MTNGSKSQPKAPVGLKIGIDPMRTPVLYADAIGINSSENGFVLDVAQRIAQTNQAAVVTRIGLSKEHVKKLVEELTKHLSLREGQSATGKVKIFH